MPWRHRHRRGRRGRFPKPITISNPAKTQRFVPFPRTNSEPIIIEPEEVEALRLVDLEGLSQEEAGKKMGVSRGTVWRFLQTAREKTARALAEGKPLEISSLRSNGDELKTS